MMPCLFRLSRLSAGPPARNSPPDSGTSWPKFRAQGALEVAHTAGLSTQNIHEKFGVVRYQTAAEDDLMTSI